MGAKSPSWARACFMHWEEKLSLSLKNLEESQAVALLCQYEEPLSLLALKHTWTAAFPSIRQGLVGCFQFFFFFMKKCKAWQQCCAIELCR